MHVKRETFEQGFYGIFNQQYSLSFFYYFRVSLLRVYIYRTIYESLRWVPRFYLLCNEMVFVSDPQNKIK